MSDKKRLPAGRNGPDRTAPSTLGEMLAERGVSRRSFLKFASYTASIMALPPTAATAIAQGLANARRQSVIWLSFQECTGCTESITRAHSPSIEDLIFDFISLDYHHTLQNASGHAAEAARMTAMKENAGEYIVVVDGSVPLKDDGIYSTIAGISNLQMLEETVKDAFAVIAVGTCATFGGIPGANPNPTGAVGIGEIVTNKPVINISGCPPIPEAMTGTIAYLLSFGAIPELDHLGRPKAFFGEAIHDRCYRRPFYERGMFARSFDDEGARQGWCLYEVGCKGPVTYNACATLKWNGGVSFPIQSGHGCLGCSEPGFWDLGGFYKPLSTAKDDPLKWAAGAAAVGAAVGAASAVAARKLRSKALKAAAAAAPPAAPAPAEEKE
jgi:hydrogenase small subunit